MNKSKKIVLIGFMGSGKTSLGKKLANNLAINFYDLDDEIEKETGESINQLFDNYGEDSFRETEQKILKKIITKNEDFILSLGGGTPCYYDNMKIINQYGTSFYLKYNAGILTSRLLDAKTQRPLIKGLNEIQLKQFITDKLNEREVFYNDSTFVLEKNNLKVEDLMEVISGC